ncbi:MAG: DUF438 domain-containing protein, partial [Candidatus Bathyarchaeia archaeon]
MGEGKSSSAGIAEARRQVLKGLIRRLHEGASFEEVKENLREIIKGTSGIEIAEVEEELMREGLPRGEAHRLCDIHLALSRES